MKKGHAPLWLAIGATLVGLILSLAIKEQCVVYPWANNHQYKSLCYNDLQPLYGVRGISKGLVPYSDVQIEYPVITGMFMDGMGKLLRALGRMGFVRTVADTTYFNLSAVFLAPFAIVVTLLLRKRTTTKRLMLWALGTPLVLYAFHNWDLIAVAFATWGAVAAMPRQSLKRGAAWALGASAKLYPIFLMPSALLSKIAKREYKGAAALLGGFAFVYAIVNVPWAIAASGVPPVYSKPDWPKLIEGIDQMRRPTSNGWLGTWLFHAKRYPDFGTVWYWIAHHGRVLVPTGWWDPGQSGYRDFVSIASFLLFAGLSIFILWRGWLRSRESGSYPVLASGFGIICAFLLTSKVHSPQYALWLVPFFVLLDVDLDHILGYMAADLGVFISGFYYFTVMNSPSPAWQGIFEVTVLARAVMLAVLMFDSLKASPISVLPAPEPPTEAMVGPVEEISGAPA
ncbi:MAG: hypothetical protein ABR507_11995 [Actinomycetota bacterium]|nr:hypothetical protein [Actinomycetota bacterium]